MDLLPRGRWLVLAGDEPHAVHLESYVERLAGTLQRLGQETLVVRVRRGVLPAVARSGVREVELAPISAPLDGAHRLLVQAIHLQRALGELARAEGAFDALLCEGALGALVGPAVAARSSLPLVLALPHCEAARRRNQLTREQLYLAELEHWGAERARAVIAPTRAVASGVERFYRRSATVVPVPVEGLEAPRRPGLLGERLGLPSSHVLLLAEDLTEAERAALFAHPTDRAVVWAGPDLWVRAPGGPFELRAPGRVRGPVLGALLAGAEAVLVHDQSAERRADAAALAPRFASIEPRGPSGAPGEAGELGALDAHLRVAAPTEGPPALPALEGIVAQLLQPQPEEALDAPALL